MTKQREILCIIPARGGSKSVPRKNILPMLGRPMIAWSIKHALESNYIGRVIVSTDDEEIAKISKEWGAEVPFIRPSEYAQDDSTDIDTFLHAINWLETNEDYYPNLIVHLRPTGPARRVKIIDSAIELMLELDEADSLRSVSLASQNPYKMWRIEDGGFMQPIGTVPGKVDAHSIPRQMLPKAYWQNGYVDIVRRKTLINFKSMVGEKVLPYIFTDTVRDLDYLDDIPIIEAELKSIYENPDFVTPLQENGDRFPV